MFAVGVETCVLCGGNDYHRQVFDHKSLSGKVRGRYPAAQVSEAEIVVVGVHLECLDLVSKTSPDSGYQLPIFHVEK